MASENNDSTVNVAELMTKASEDLGDEICAVIPSRARSSHGELGPRHCPAAVAHARLGTPRGVSHEMLIGKAIHAVAEAIATTEGSPTTVADAAVIEMCTNGLRFEGGPPETPTLEQACEGRRLALSYLDKHDLPQGFWMQAELEVNMTPNGWSLIEAKKCECLTEEDPLGIFPGRCKFCRGSGEFWSPHWHQLLDLAWQEEGEDAYENPVMIAGGRDYKGWDAGAGWFDRTQGAGYAVALASLFPEAQIIRRECAGYQNRSLFNDEIDLRTEEGQDRLDEYRLQIELSIKVQTSPDPDIEALAMPGSGCFGGFGGCPYLPRCQPALRRGSRLVESIENGNRIAFCDAETSAEAFALGSALAQEGKRQLAGHGGGPIRTPSGQNVGWQDTTSPQGKVDDNAPLWISREYATFVLKRPDAQPEVEGLIRSAGVGKSGAGVTVARKLVDKCIHAGMPDADGKGLLERCLKPKHRRQLAIWRGRLPDPEPDEHLANALRKSLKVIKSGESAGTLQAPGDPITTD